MARLWSRRSRLFIWGLLVAWLVCASGCRTLDLQPLSHRIEMPSEGVSAIDVPDASLRIADPTESDAYRTQVLSLLRSAMKGGPIDGADGLEALTPIGASQVPIVMHGFSWTSADVNRLFEYRWTPSAKLKRRHCRPGVGVPLVAVRWRPCDEPHLRAIHPFAVTAILRPSDVIRDGQRGGNASPALMLELHNPQIETEVEIDGRRYPLAADLSAPVEYWMSITEKDSKVVAGFFHPDEGQVKPRLSFIAPHQPGRIPVVFVHGLASDAGTWLATYNDLQAEPEFCRRYQVWAFRYPTGRGFLASAAALREALLAAREECDPQHQDAMLDQMVLVGHSMGGLLSKLQVVSPGTRLWEAVGRGSFEDLRVTPKLRDEVSRLLFFEPTPSVARVVFIGTPHRGASMAARPLARIASKSVSMTDEQSDPYDALLIDNIDRLHPWLWMGHPTSVDMLIPGNPILEGMRKLPIVPHVPYHSIIGTQGLILEGGSDGVVQVESARHPGAVSEVYVPDHHSGLQSNPTTVAELLRIFEEHAAIQAPVRTQNREEELVAPGIGPASASGERLRTRGR